MSDMLYEYVEDARIVVASAFRWQLTQRGWQKVDELLEQLRQAVEAGDLAAVRQATAELELAGPRRVAEPNPEATSPPPDPVEEQLNHLVHAINLRWPQPEPPPSDAVDFTQGG